MEEPVRIKGQESPEDGVVPPAQGRGKAPPEDMKPAGS